MNLKCDCSVEYSEKGYDGEPTETNYLGNGVFKCPKCNNTYDNSTKVYEICVEIKKDDDDEEYNTISIIEPYIDEKIKEIANKETNTTIREIIEEDFIENFDSEWLQKHQTGVFDLILYWSWVEYHTDCGTEYDLDMWIISEKEVKHKLEIHSIKEGKSLVSNEEITETEISGVIELLKKNNVFLDSFMFYEKTRIIEVSDIEVVLKLLTEKYPNKKII